MVFAPTDTIAPRSLHISRVLGLPPLAAEAALDACRNALTGAERVPAPDVWTVRGDSARISLVGAGTLVRHTGLDPYRRWFGSLGPVDRRPGLPVEMELGPWSGTRCELGLRPAGRSARWADSRWRRRWFSLGLDAMDELTEAVDAAAWQGIVGALDAPTRPHRRRRIPT